MLLELSLGFITVTLIWFLYDQVKFKEYPPGPLRFPLLGSLPHLALYSFRSISKTPTCVLYQLSKVYGDIMHVRMGLIDFVVFSSYDSMKELLSTNGVGNRKYFDYFGDRMDEPNHGIIFSNDSAWNTMRRFTIRTLRLFGFGKSASMGAVITEEANKYVDYVKSKMIGCSDNTVLHVDGNMFGLSAANIICRLVTGKAYDLENERMKKLLKLGNDYIASLGMVDIIICYPVLRKLFPKWCEMDKQCESLANFKGFIAEVVEEHSNANRRRGDEAECFIDLFLDEIENKKEFFTHEQLKITLLDLFQAGSDTTSKTLALCMLQLVRNPDLQERIYKEIASSDQHAPPYSFLEMKEKLPLCFSMLMEILRFTTLVGSPPPYQCYQDVKIGGYTIKAETALMVNLESMHRNERIWADSEIFRPERFLDENGIIISEMCEYVVTFGRGKRSCVGQTLAESTLSIFFYNLVKNFKFSIPNGQKNLPCVIPQPGIVYGTKPFDVDITVR